MIKVNTRQLVDSIREADAFKIPDMNEGTGYLYNELYKRLSSGEDVLLSGIDFNAFDYEDITSLNELYADVFERNGSRADGIVSALHKLSPVCKAVGYV